MWCIVRRGSARQIWKRYAVVDPGLRELHFVASHCVHCSRQAAIHQISILRYSRRPWPSAIQMLRCWVGVARAAAGGLLCSFGRSTSKIENSDRCLLVSGAPCGSRTMRWRLLMALWLSLSEVFFSTLCQKSRRLSLLKEHKKRRCNNGPRRTPGIRYFRLRSSRWRWQQGRGEGRLQTVMFLVP